MEKQIKLKVVDGVVVTTSDNFAEVIGAEHKDVLKTIKYLISVGFDEKQFKQIFSETNNRNYVYHISKSGTVILADIIDKVSNLKLIQKGLEMFDKMESNKK